MTHTADPHHTLLASPAAASWKQIGIRRRAGVVAPLFSVYSSKSSGIGEFPDIKLLVDWCLQTGMSLIQLLPMNDVGHAFRPYDAQSSFALEPMHLCIDDLVRCDVKPFAAELASLRQRFPIQENRVDYRIKHAKISLLRKIFQARSPRSIEAFQAFSRQQRFWLEDYALFKVIKNSRQEMGWEEWPHELRSRDPEALKRIKESNSQDILFQEWLQWQCYEQFKQAKKYAASQQVILMGDIPFLVSRDSADVWSRQDYFKLDLSSGAPPDMLFGRGQRWGMPPYHWDHIAGHGYDYVKEKLRYAENFYDMYRIDHVVGIFRVWSIKNSEPQESGGLNGFFDPSDEQSWDEHGRRLLGIMLDSSRMLACAEDLGTIPPKTFKTLAELGIPGIDIQRWMRDWGKSYDFKDPSAYRPTALATLGTHDMSCFEAWWQFEAGTVDEILFTRKCAEKGLNAEELKGRLFDPQLSRHGRLRWKPQISGVPVFLQHLGCEEWRVKDLIDMYLGSFDEKEKFLHFLGMDAGGPKPSIRELLKASLEKINGSSCIFATQLLQDWLCLDGLFDMDPWEMRINFPGTLSDRNWTLAMPMPLDDILNLPVNSIIKKINSESGRF